MNKFSPGDQVIFLNNAFTGITSFYLNQNKAAELKCSEAQPVRAFFDFHDKRFELNVIKGKDFFKRGSLQVNLAGNVQAEMKTNWSGNRGEILSRWKHLYSFGLTKDKNLILKLDSENAIIFTISKKNKKGERIIDINYTELETDELLTLISVMCFYIIRLENAHQTAALIPPVTG